MLASQCIVYHAPTCSVQHTQNLHATHTCTKASGACRHLGRSVRQAHVPVGAVVGTVLAGAPVTDAETDPVVKKL